MHTGFGVCELDPGGDGARRTCTPSRRASTSSRAAASLDTPEGSVPRRPGRLRAAPGRRPARLAQRRSTDPCAGPRCRRPAPRRRLRRRHRSWSTRCPRRDPVADRRPRPAHRRFGTHQPPSTWTSARQSQDLLAVSASMRTALLVYSGITVKMMVDSDLGAQLTTMFMVQYDPDGVAGRARPPVRGDVLLPRGSGRGDLRRRDATSSAPATSPGPASAACTASATSAAARCAGWRPRRRSRRRGTPTGSPGTGTT